MLDGLPIAPISAGGLVGLVVLMILTGRLVPRRTHDDALKDRDAWRTAHGALREQMQEIIPLIRATHAVLTAVPHAARRVREDDS
jgi:hypothetical protein